MPDWLVTLITAGFVLMGTVVTTVGGVMIAKLNAAKKHAEAAAAAADTAAANSTRAQALAKTTARSTAVVREQVKNSHQTNLRDDLDIIRGLAERALEGIDGLREENREDRRATAKRFEGIEQRHDELAASVNAHLQKEQ